MSGIERSSGSGYQPVPQSADTWKRPNSVSIDLSASPKFKDLLGAFTLATGDPDAPLRAAQDKARVSIVVPASPGSVPSMWTRFKAALSNLPLLNRVSSLRTARQEVSDVPLDEHQFAGAVLRNGILSAIRSEFGDRAADDAYQQMGDKPLTKRTVERVLKHAVDEGYVRRYHLPRMEPEQQPERGGAAKVREASKGLRPERPMTALEVAVQMFGAERNPPLLKYCVNILRPGHADLSPYAIAEKAKDLHDRAQAYLTERGQWPITDTDFFQQEVMPLVAVMAEQADR